MERRFVDRQVRGPMRRWRHEHVFEPLGPERCRLIDRIDWEFPLPPLGRWVAEPWLRAMLSRMFQVRHRITCDDLTQHARWQQTPRRSIAVLAGRDWLGDGVAAYLSTAGHRVYRPAATVWPATQPSEPVDVVVDLRDLAQRDLAQRDLALRSLQRSNPVRVEPLLGSDQPRVTVLVTRQSDAAGDNQPPELDAQNRVVNIRVGAVLPDRPGLAVSQLCGAGRQPWIAFQDLLGAIESAVCDENWHGVVDLAAPEHADARSLARAVSGARSPSAVNAPPPGPADSAPVLGLHLRYGTLESVRACFEPRA